MKTLSILFTLISLFTSDKATHQKIKTEAVNFTDVVRLTDSDPLLLTSYAELSGGYAIMDEYYMKDGAKVLHGLQKHFNASGEIMKTCRYEHGEMEWTKVYD